MLKMQGLKSSRSAASGSRHATQAHWVAPSGRRLAACGHQMGTPVQRGHLTRKLEALKTEVAPKTEQARKSESAPKAESGVESKPRSLLLLLHGEKAQDNLLRDAISRLRDEGHKVTVRVTYEGGDVDRLVREAIELKSADTLVSAGGDGTICEVVDALLKYTGGLEDMNDSSATLQSLDQVAGNLEGPDEVSVAILPMGTSNDFAATTGLPEDPYEALLLATKRDCIRRIDVGVLNGKVFMNTATIGASAEAGKVTSSGLKKILGPFAFIVTGWRSVGGWVPVPSDLSFPDKEPAAKDKVDEKGKSEAHTPSSKSSGARASADQPGTVVSDLQGVPLLHLTAANNRQIASMVAIAPNAVLDDGMLDCVYFTGDAREQARRVVRDLVWKGADSTKVVSTLLRVPWLEVETEQPLEWALDGDSMPEKTNKFRFSTLHRAVPVHLPDNRMLVAGQPIEPEPEEGGVATKKPGKLGVSNPLRLPRGKLHRDSLSDMVGSVTRYRKPKDWGLILRNGAIAGGRFLVGVAVGGAVVHYLDKL